MIMAPQFDTTAFFSSSSQPVICDIVFSLSLLCVSLPERLMTAAENSLSHKSRDIASKKKEGRNELEDGESIGDKC